jgi:hypothetical protein
MNFDDAKALSPSPFSADFGHYRGEHIAPSGLRIVNRLSSFPYPAFHWNFPEKLSSDFPECHGHSVSSGSMNISQLDHRPTDKPKHSISE